MSSLQDELSKLRQSRTQQLTRDQALDLALQAADLHVKFLRIAKEGPEKDELRRRTSSVLDEAQRIKTTETWDTDSQPLITFDALEPSRPAINGDHNTPSAQTERTKNAQSMLGGSELNLLDDSDIDDGISPKAHSQGGMARKSALVAPSSTRVLSKKEQILLLKSSELNGCKFPPWEKTPRDRDFGKSDGDKLFIDETVFRMSKEQLHVLDDWRRPSYALPPPSWDRAVAENTGAFMSGPTMERTKFTDFVQDAATDCSVVVSLATGAARASQGHEKLLSSIMFPYDTARQIPCMSANGKYILRLNFNGCQRRVIIDDRLPVSKTERILHVVDRNNPGLLWPALIEKAYLKVRGGYDFPGSNSGTDLWMLSGWIPEQVFFQHEEVDLLELWVRISNHFTTGDVMMTLGTGPMTGRAEQHNDLAGEHCYAVLQMSERNGRKMLLVKNPWLDAKSWKDPRTILPEETSAVAQEGSAVRTNMNGDVDVDVDVDVPTKGTFWMAIDDVQQYFDFMYLNWNPGFFAHRQDIHFSWDLATERSAPGSYATHPQFSLTCAGGGPIWLLLQKHFIGGDEATALSSSKAAEDGMIGLCAFDQSEHRVYLADGADELGILVDSPQALLKLDAQRQASYTIVADQEECELKALNFTLTAFAEKPIKIEHALSRYTNSTKSTGNWTAATAGCTENSENFDENPQYTLTLPESSSISLLLETRTRNVRVRVMLFRSQGERISEIRGLVADSGRYSGQAAHANLQVLKAGSYTIVCATYEPNEPADFKLQVETMVQHTVKTVPREDAGRITERLSDASFAAGVRAVASPFTVQRLCRVKFKIEYEAPLIAYPSNKVDREGAPLRSPFRLSVEAGEAPNRSFFMTSGNGQFVMLKKGIMTEEIDLTPPSKRSRTMWLVLERMGGHDASDNPEERIKVSMMADAENPITFGVWRDHAL